MSINHSNVVMANKVLDYLKARDGIWCQTIPMMRSMEIEDNTGNRSRFRHILDRLYSAGKIYKKGTGKFKWKLIVEEWDRDNPFAPEKNAPNPTHATSGTEPAGSYTSEPEPEPEPHNPCEPIEPATPHYGSSASSTEVEDLRDRVKMLEKAKQEHATVLVTLIENAARLNKAIDAAGQTTKTLKIEKWDGTVHTLKNVVLPKVFNDVLDLAKCRRNILLVGPAGCGKTHLAGLIAETLGLQFGSVSLTSGISESHLLGKAMPNLTSGESNFQGTDFVTCYEKGGVYLLDEFDAADPNLLLCINSALANGYCNLPNRPKKARANKHADFIPIATANTFGRGATRQYSGRNQLDEATLDRFRIGIVECNYDPAIEAAVCPDSDLRGRLQQIRLNIEEAGLRRIMSTRFLQDAFIMKSVVNWDNDKIVKTFFEGWTEDEKSKVLSA